MSFLEWLSIRACQQDFSRFSARPTLSMDSECFVDELRGFVHEESSLQCPDSIDFAQDRQNVCTKRKDHEYTSTRSDLSYLKVLFFRRFRDVGFWV